ncbi:hypothetical protein KEC48_06490 [Clostridium sp. C1]|uniref:hypothetical protein n=1 Tax=Clostridium sp. C1 TaxID=1155388 RepID=UPI001BA6F2D8|nr:hypothetical protein [Clostridium sp. C1]QUN14153.1 hypothetical protein KEC48_06490 [Clostridium sp. C1]
MEIKAYDIGKEYKEIELSDIQINNINRIFFEIVENQREKRNKLSVVCCLKQENRNVHNVIYDYYLNHTATFDYSVFASKLSDAEKTKDGRSRKQSIQEGFLFIKSEKNNLYLMKLEKIKDVDSTTFEIKGALGTDNNYYKLCIFEDDFNKILIVDKNTRLASYWFDKFLGLTRVRDEHQNTSILIDLINEKKLFNNQIFSQNKIPEIYSYAEDFLFNNDNFEKMKLIEDLYVKGLLEENVNESVYSVESDKIDAQFIISKKSIKEKYKKSISISPDTTIKTDNFLKLKKRQGIKLEGNELTLIVDDEFLREVNKVLS